MPCNKPNCKCTNSCVRFAKSSTSDPTNPKNQDCITKNVALSRLTYAQITTNKGVLFNPKKEAIGDVNFNTSPLNTLWTVGSWADISCRLDNVDWTVFGGLSNIIGGLTALPGTTVIMYSTLDKQYYQIKFIVWGSKSEGSVEVVYQRCKCPLPVPAKFKCFVPTEYIVNN